MAKIEIDDLQLINIEDPIDNHEKYKRFQSGKYGVLDIMDNGTLTRRIWFVWRKT